MHRSASIPFIGAVLCCFQASLVAAFSYCVNSNDVCFRWALPESASKSSSSDVYFQVEAPDTYQWVALGIGSQMSGASIFVIYSNGKGNVTLSTRAGTGHSMPEHVTMSKVELIEGSGTKNGSLIANIKCGGGCKSLDLSGDNDWISAWKKGTSMHSTDAAAGIDQHDDFAQFTMDMAKVDTFSSGNPFMTSEDSSTGSSKNNTSSDAVSSGSSGSSTEGTSKAHGIIMAVVFVLAYPLGAFLMPVLGKWMFHASWQILAFIGMWIGFGLGYMAAQNTGTWNKANHVKLGAAVCILMAAQPFLGFAHHRYFVAHQQRGIISHVHIWYGRILMTLGILNGGLGLRLAGASRGYLVAYSVVTILITVLYLVGASVLESRRARRTKRGESYQMSHDGGFR